MKLLLFISLSLSTAFAGGKVTMKIGLSPMGSFEAKTSKVYGKVKKGKKGYTTKNLYIETKSLKTGIDLRDKHLKEKLLYKKHPKITIEKGTFKGKSGVAIINVMGKKKKIKFKGKVVKNKLNFEFDLSMKDFGVKKVKYLGVGAKDKVSIVGVADISK
ncbi:YceI family protein [Bacteriovoracaceae bacterium]|nr:YceI family protein [Bacteriovoracaceae bacterium]